MFGKNINIVVDAAKELLTNTLKYRPYLIKPNNFELSDILGKNLETDEEITDGARKLRKMLPGFASASKKSGSFGWGKEEALWPSFCVY